MAKADAMGAATPNLSRYMTQGPQDAKNLGYTGNNFSGQLGSNGIAGSLLQRMGGQQNPYQMGIGAGLNNQPMQGLFGNASNQMPQANMLPTSNQSIQDLLYPSGGQGHGFLNTIGRGIGGSYF